jgi:hypothetical protein
MLWTFIRNSTEVVVCLLQVVDSETYPEGYILEGSTPVATEEQRKEADGEAAAQENGPARADAVETKAMAVDGEVIDLLDDDKYEKEMVKVGAKRRLVAGDGPSTSKMQKTDDVIELD